MKQRKYSLNALLNSNRFVLILSIVIAIGIWLVVAIQFSPETTKTFTGIPVVIEESATAKNNNLVNFTDQEYTVSVTVSGKRFAISNLEPENIRVYANTSYVDTAGRQTVTLERVEGIRDESIEVKSITPREINLYYDRNATRILTLETEIHAPEEGIAPEGYLVDHERLSASQITVEGAETEINKIARVVVGVTLDSQIRKTTTVENPTISFLSAYGSELTQYISIKNNPKIALTIPVYKKVTMPISVSFHNAPAAYASKSLPVTFSPATASFGISEDRLEKLESVVVGTIDFAKIPGWQKTTFTFSAVGLMDDIKALEDTPESFQVTVDTTDMISQRFTPSNNNIIFQNVPDTLQVEVLDDLGSVTVIGPEDSLNKLTSNNVYADVDIESADQEIKAGGTYTCAARLYVRGVDDCWVYGEYRVQVRLNEKTNT